MPEPTRFNSIEVSDEAKITTANLVAAAGANPTKAEYDLCVALVNELKAKLNKILK